MVGVFLLTFSPGKCVCLERGSVGRLGEMRALRWGRGHPDGYWNRAPPQQKSVLGVGSCRGSKARLPLAQRCLVGGWAAQGFGGFRTNKQGSVRAQRSESPSGPEVPIKVFFPLF